MKPHCTLSGGGYAQASISTDTHWATRWTVRDPDERAVRGITDQTKRVRSRSATGGSS